MVGSPGPGDSSYGSVSSGSMPAVELRSAYWRQSAFYGDPEVGLDAQTMPLRLAVMLTPLDPELPQHPLGGVTGSWTFFAGAPSRPAGSGLDWPRRHPDPGAGRGTPLTHVLQVDLYGLRLDQGERVVADTGLPATGLLQFFHDCVTYGDEGADADAWTVRWVPRDAAASAEAEQGSWEPTPRPADLDPEGFADPVPLGHEVAPSVPNLAGLQPGPAEARERYARLYEWIEEHPYDRNLGRRPEHLNPLTPWDPGFEPLPAATRLMGFSAVPANEDYDQLVREHLPLEPGDTHLLLADINPDQFEDAPLDWFHGGRHVEFWIRRSDLAEQRFDRTWALIRTDH